MRYIKPNSIILRDTRLDKQGLKKPLGRRGLKHGITMKQINDVNSYCKALQKKGLHAVVWIHNGWLLVRSNMKGQEL